MSVGVTFTVPHSGVYHEHLLAFGLEITAWYLPTGQLSVAMVARFDQGLRKTRTTLEIQTGSVTVSETWAGMRHVPNDSRSSTSVVLRRRETVPSAPWVKRIPSESSSLFRW
ncbi:hypothetical protein DFH07DRAFT_771873 [Mycena maculata]|uniref:Uncharacterized protein n=1 Tax=Mycena maculata TaxID=230809 RepID=A0AAD7NFN5_9AGAR|nr:hypothetical protein DFH07DRAFT_771873 [Mycena maculata]